MVKSWIEHIDMCITRTMKINSHVVDILPSNASAMLGNCAIRTIQCLFTLLPIMLL